MAGSSLTFEAFAHPLRARILARLVERPSSPSEMAREFGVSIGVVSYHTRRLEQLGIASVVETRRVQTRRGPPQTFYRATQVHMSDEEWLRVPPVVRMALAEAALRELGRRV